MTDRELLEAAAKAAGFYITDEWQGHERYKPKWNPLTDDGDALRLLNKSWLELRHVHAKVHAGLPNRFWCTEDSFPDVDQDAATRRAIVRAAAAMGKP